ncbi:hypothetical protein [Rhodococcus koreensis]|uniref:hypothetical protein n=1 Tax=Rhodococcus koreensis TaxID=99653 RepID=UPI000AF7ADAF|nr:hypothetical protein [Rhodococcus koreensis]
MWSCLDQPLSDRLDAARVTPEALGECRRQVTAVAQLTISAEDLSNSRPFVPAGD